MTSYVYCLYEYDEDSCRFHGLFSDKKKAYKKMLEIKKSRVYDAFEFSKTYGESSAEYCYRYHSDDFFVEMQGYE